MVAIAFGLDFAEVPGATPKKPASGLMARTYGSHLPAFESLGRDEHGKIGFAARAGKCCSHIGFFVVRRFDAENEHVLREPALIARNN